MERRSALNVWLSMVDDFLEKQTPLTHSMILAANRLHEMQKELSGHAFHPVDLINSTADIMYMLRKRPDWNEGFLTGASPM